MISHYSTKSTVSTIIQNTIFTFTLNGKELEKKKLVYNYNEWENTNMFHNFTLDY